MLRWPVKSVDQPIRSYLDLATEAAYGGAGLSKQEFVFNGLKCYQNILNIRAHNTLGPPSELILLLVGYADFCIILRLKN